MSDTMLSEMRHRDPLLFWTGTAMLLTLVVVTLRSISDTRLILGLNPWVKPMKFLTSVTIFLWTVAWFMPETRDNPVVSGVSRINAIRWTIAGSMIIEIACVILQSARGATSHYNISSPFDAAVFAVMGTTIGFTTVAMAMFLWLIRRDTPAQRAGYLWGIRLGIAIFMLAGVEGNLLIFNNAHTVGLPDGGPGLPFLNWSTKAGDLRIAHFFGMHAMQALPLLGFLLDRSRRDVRSDKPGLSSSRNLMFAVSIVWLAVMGGLLALALQGRPLVSF